MFTQRTLDFLYFNHKYNSPEWYKAHKDDYEKYLVLPFKQFVEDLTPTMLTIDDRFIVEPKHTLSRLYRDMRYATDGYRYRDRMWCVFMRDKKMYEGLPGYFFEVTPYNFSYGCGYYQADAATLRTFRKLIATNSPEFQAALECVKKQPVFEVYGDAVRLPDKYKNLSPDAQDWLSRNNIGVIAESKDYELLMSENLSSIIAKHFASIAPFYKLMITAESMR